LGEKGSGERWQEAGPVLVFILEARGPFNGDWATTGLTSLEAMIKVILEIKMKYLF
jgi:hypothetical protein